MARLPPPLRLVDEAEQEQGRLRRRGPTASTSPMRSPMHSRPASLARPKCRQWKPSAAEAVSQEE
eukprot:7314122-Lingulodinium_polyedra.AAC.1